MNKNKIYLLNNLLQFGLANLLTLVNKKILFVDKIIQ